MIPLYLVKKTCSKLLIATLRFVLATLILVLLYSDSTNTGVSARRIQVRRINQGPQQQQCDLGFVGFCVKAFPAPVLPADQWLHNRTSGSSPTIAAEENVPLIAEWWWTSGTLVSDEGRELGIEINSAGFYNDTALHPTWPLSGFNQISVPDVNNKRYFQTTAENHKLPLDWATYDSNKPWAINHPGDMNGQGKVTMKQVGNWSRNGIISINAKTSFIDEFTKIVTKIDLIMTQRQGKKPLYVNGDGLICSNPVVENPMDQYNFYYSLTHLDTSGTIEIGDEKHTINGLLWQDHQYGFFSLEYIKWVLQNLQLDNGVHLTNFYVLDPITSENPRANVALKSQMTILDEKGDSYCAESYMVARGDKIPNTEYFRQYQLSTNALGGCSWNITSAFDEQYFTTLGKTIFEGVAHISGRCGNKPSTGTAWLEQAMFETGGREAPTRIPSIKVSEKPSSCPPVEASTSPAGTRSNKTQKSKLSKRERGKQKKKFEKKGNSN